MPVVVGKEDSKTTAGDTATVVHVEMYEGVDTSDINNTDHVSSGGEDCTVDGKADGAATDDDLAEESENLTQPSCLEILSVSRPEWPWLVLGVVSTFVALVCDMAQVYVYSKAFDTVVIARGVSQSDETESADFSLTQLMTMQLSLNAAQHIFGQFADLLYSLTGERAVARLRQRLFGSILLQEVGLFDRRKSGEFVSRLGTDVDTIRGAVSHELAGMIYNAVKFILAAALFQIMVGTVNNPLQSSSSSALMSHVNTTTSETVESADRTLILALLGASSVTWWVTFFYYTRAISRVSIKYQDTVALAAAISQEAISSLRTLRSFAAEEYELSRYTKIVGKPRTCSPCSPCPSTVSALHVGVQRSFLRISGEGILKCMPGVFLISLNYWGFEAVSNGSIKPGALIGAMIYTLHFAGSLVALIHGLGRLVEARGASARVFELIHRQPLTAGGGKRPVLHGTLQFRNVTFNYPTRPDINVLKNLSLDVPQGMTTAIVGASGSGKTTLLELVLRFYEVQEGCGSLWYDSHDILEIDPVWLRRHVAMVQQEPVLFGMSIRDNIMYARAAAGEEVSEEEMINASVQAHAHDFVMSFPEGYDTLVGERGVRLSGGQKQRVALARAVLTNPQLLLLDEATSALDSTSERLVQKALDTMMVGRTVIMVAHRLSTVRNAEQIVVLDSGAIEDVGTHTELLERCEVYKTLVSKQIEQS